MSIVPQPHRGIDLIMGANEGLGRGMQQQRSNEFQQQQADRAQAQVDYNQSRQMNADKQTADANARLDLPGSADIDAIIDHYANAITNKQITVDEAAADFNAKYGRNAPKSPIVQQGMNQAGVPQQAPAPTPAPAGPSGLAPQSAPPQAPPQSAPPGGLGNPGGDPVMNYHNAAHALAQKFISQGAPPAMAEQMAEQQTGQDIPPQVAQSLGNPGGAVSAPPQAPPRPPIAAAPPRRRTLREQQLFAPMLPHMMDNVTKRDVATTAAGSRLGVAGIRQDGQVLVQLLKGEDNDEKRALEKILAEAGYEMRKDVANINKSATLGAAGITGGSRERVAQTITDGRKAIAQTKADDAVIKSLTAEVGRLDAAEASGIALTSAEKAANSARRLEKRKELDAEREKRLIEGDLDAVEELDALRERLSKKTSPAQSQQAPDMSQLPPPKTGGSTPTKPKTPPPPKKNPPTKPGIQAKLLKGKNAGKTVTVTPEVLKANPDWFEVK